MSTLLINGSTPFRHADSAEIWAQMVYCNSAYLLAAVPGQLHVLVEYEEPDGTPKLVLIKVTEDRQQWTDKARQSETSTAPAIQPLTTLQIGDFAFEEISYVHCFISDGGTIKLINDEIAMDILRMRDHPIRITTDTGVVLADIAAHIAPEDEDDEEPFDDPVRAPAPVEEPKDFARLKVDAGYSNPYAENIPVLLTVKSVKFLTNQYAPDAYNERGTRWTSDMTPANMFDSIYDSAENLNQHMAEAARTVRSWIKSNLSYLLHPSLRDTHEFLSDIQMTFEVTVLELGKPLTYDRIRTVTIDFWTE